MFKDFSLVLGSKGKLLSKGRACIHLSNDSCSKLMHELYSVVQTTFNIGAFFWSFARFCFEVENALSDTLSFAAK